MINVVTSAVLGRDDETYPLSRLTTMFDSFFVFWINLETEAIYSSQHGHHDHLQHHIDRIGISLYHPACRSSDHIVRIVCWYTLLTLSVYSPQDTKMLFGLSKLTTMFNIFFFFSCYNSLMV